MGMVMGVIRTTVATATDTVEAARTTAATWVTEEKTTINTEVVATKVTATEAETDVKTMDADTEVTVTEVTVTAVTVTAVTAMEAETDMEAIAMGGTATVAIAMEVTAMDTVKEALDAVEIKVDIDNYLPYSTYL